MIIGVSRVGIPRIPVPEAKQKAGRMHTFTQHILLPARSCLGRIRQMAATACAFALMAFITTPAQAASTVQFWATTTSVLEGSKAMLTVQRSGGLETPVSVRYSTSDKTALAGSDYLAASGTLSFAAGERSRMIEVAILDDTLPENVEEFQVTLSQPST